MVREAHPAALDEVGLQQVLGGQPLQDLLGAVVGQPECGRRDPYRHRGHLQQAEQAEGPLLGGRQGGVADREAVADAEVADHQLVQPAAFGLHAAGELLQAPVRALQQPRAGDPDGQRQPAAVPHQVLRRPFLRGQPVRADDPAQDVGGLLGREEAEALVPGAPEGRQHLQAGHHGRAGRRGREQGPYLGLVAGAVQHDQHPAVGEQPPVQGHQFTGLRGQVPGCDPEGAQEFTEHLRRFAEAVPVLELHVQLAVGEGGADGVGDADRHGGLADPGGPVQVERLGHGALAAVPGDVPQPLDQLRLDAGPGELGEARREGVRGRRARDAGEDGGRGGGRGFRFRFRCGGGPGGPGEDLPVGGPELFAGFDAEFLRQQPAGLLIGAEGLALAARPIQGGHEPAPCAFPERVFGYQGPQPGQHFRVPPDRHFRVGPVFRGVQPPFKQGGPVSLLEVFRRDVDERGALGLLHGLTEQPGPLGAFGALLRLLQQGVEAVEVELLASGHDGVAGGAADDDLGAQDFAQAGDVALERLARGQRGLAAPQLLDEFLRRERTARPQQQGCQYDPVFRLRNFY